MAAIDAEADESLDELIGRAAWAVARQATRMLGNSPYGKRVAVLVGKGNNGEDGRRAVPHLERRGAHCTVIEVGGEHGSEVGRKHAGGMTFDLVVDACFGTGLTRDFDAAIVLDAGTTPVLAVDIPSGVDGLTGELRGFPFRATETITFAAPKPGLLLAPGRDFVGELTVADIGLDCSRGSIELVEPADVVGLWPRRDPAAHKWRHAVYIIGGSPGMAGAPSLAATAALRSGAGYAALSILGAAATHDGLGGPEPAHSTPPSAAGPIEAVRHPVSDTWAVEVLGRLDRFGAAVIGPGVAIEQQDQVSEYLKATAVPTVVDAGALPAVASLLAQGWRSPVEHVITPHDGEFAVLTGVKPGADRVSAARELAQQLSVVVLLKGQTTVVAHPDGRAALSVAGDDRLATAGTGDVLSGIIAAGLAGGLEPLLAAALGAELHGLAGRRCRRVGMTAGDLPPAIADFLSASR